MQDCPRRTFYAAIDAIEKKDAEDKRLLRDNAFDPLVDCLMNLDPILNPEQYEDKVKSARDHLAEFINSTGDETMTNELLQLDQGANRPTQGPWRKCRKTAVVEAMQLTTDVVCRNRENEENHGKAGDYLFEDGHGSYYVCSRKVFESTYEFLEGGDVE